ncbi:hypothetical protein RDI58_025247 [Solanum bulbocastanum]|uniref:Uncharacterized protein n=1 Tax=Solanum bulbocastanum TaxID=147425 RepID=A0AAN8SZR5_SOLBU
MNSGISFIHGVLNDGFQSEKWNGGVSGSASPIDFKQFDHYWIQARMMLEVLAKKTVLFKKQVDQLENFHLPLLNQMLLLEGTNTTKNTIIDVLETAAATREVMLKAPTIEDIDKTIVAVTEHMEIIKMLQEAIFSHICAAADFVKSAGRILFKLVEKVAVPRSVFWTTKTLQMPMPSIHNVLAGVGSNNFQCSQIKAP